jgi:hypothetical protein
MFNFSRKKVTPNKLDVIEASFISSIVENLASKYPKFKDELDLETFVGVAKNPGGLNGSYTYLLNSESWKKNCDPSLNNYDIKNVKFKTYTGETAIIDIYISEGLIFGYKTSVDVKEIDTSTIDITAIWEKYYLNNDYNEISNITRSIPKENLKKLNMIKNTFRIEINNVVYYPVHELINGNYLAIDKCGVVYKIEHDPFQAKILHNTLLELIEEDFV